MFHVTIDGELKVWNTFEYALTDVLTRGLHKSFILERVTPE